MLSGAVESDCRYFEMGAQTRALDGATLAWMPGLTTSPGAAVIQRVDPQAIADGGSAWIEDVERAMGSIGATLSRIYLESRHDSADAILRGAGYVSRDELVFVDEIPESPLGLSLRPIETDADWADKLAFHEAADRTPDGHPNRATEWVELERRKCNAGMTAYLAELDGEVVGAAGAIWMENFIRTKNLVVAPHRRRLGVGRAILGRIGALGAQRGLSNQCVLAVKGEEGELLYRAMGMTMIGTQIEWSRQLSGGVR